MSTQKFLREIRRAVTDSNGKVIDEKRTGKHYKLVLDFGFGERLLVCSVSPSDGNAIDNVKRDIRRLGQA